MYHACNASALVLTPILFLIVSLQLRIHFVDERRYALWEEAVEVLRVVAQVLVADAPEEELGRWSLAGVAEERAPVVALKAGIRPTELLRFRCSPPSSRRKGS